MSKLYFSPVGRNLAYGVELDGNGWIEAAGAGDVREAVRLACSHYRDAREGHVPHIGLMVNVYRGHPAVGGAKTVFSQLIHAPHDDRCRDDALKRLQDEILASDEVREALLRKPKPAALLKVGSRSWFRKVLDRVLQRQ